MPRLKSEIIPNFDRYLSIGSVQDDGYGKLIKENSKPRIDIAKMPYFSFFLHDPSRRLNHYFQDIGHLINELGRHATTAQNNKNEMNELIGIVQSFYDKIRNKFSEHIILIVDNNFVQ